MNGQCLMPVLNTNNCFALLSALMIKDLVPSHLFHSKKVFGSGLKYCGKQCTVQ